MSINQFALQTAIYTKLSTDNNLTSTLGASVFDDIPENTPYPYVQLGEDTAIDYSTKDQTGSEVTVNIDVWSRYRGSLQAKNIMDRVHTLLHDSSLSVTGSNFINMRFEFSDIIRDPDGITRHGVMRFRAIMLG
tara:strand:- start:193 stop:594 length:402 start_codon:yes stop_codon:yes gene_type:complete